MTESALDSSPPKSVLRGINAALLFGYAGVGVAAYFLLPILVRLGAPVWAWALLPIGLIANGYWATLHESIHGQLLVSPDGNRRAGRLLAILWGSSFRLLRFGHLMHHRFNRHALDRPDCFDPNRTSATKARLRFYGEILGGLYLVEILTPLLYLLPQPVVRRLVAGLYAGTEEPMPQLRQLADQSLASPKGVAEIRQDAVLSWLLLVSAGVAWGSYWPAFAAYVFGRGLLVSLVDNVYHFRTPLDRVEFAYNLSLPRPLQALFLNMNMHRVHHRRMNAPWWQLPSFFAADRDTYDGSLMLGLARQAQGPIPNDRSDAARPG
jgi:fatty acid desaturase